MSHQDKSTKKSWSSILTWKDKKLMVGNTRVKMVWKMQPRQVVLFVLTTRGQSITSGCVKMHFKEDKIVARVQLN